MSTTNPPPTVTIATSRSPQTAQEVASHLIAIISPWCHLITTRDLDFRTAAGQAIVASLSPTFSAILDSYPDTYNWKELTDIWKEECKLFPECGIELLEARAGQVNLDQGYATVFLEMRMWFSERVELKSFTELVWKRRDEGKGGNGRWEIERFIGMRGSKVNEGFI